MKVPRQIPIAEHLWAALGRMADEMGSDREALVNQALHVFARLNGYLVPGAAFGPGGEDDPAHRALEARVLQTAAALERSMQSDAGAGSTAPSGAPAALYLRRESGELGEVAKDRFLIGRGKHCDLVVDSAKVSREHAAIVREGGAWFIEDLGSANGTWHERERLRRREIADGDEYFISSERIRCVLR